MPNRILEVIRRERKYAIFPMVCADFAASLDHVDLIEALTDAEKLAAVLERAYRVYGYDMVLVFTDPYVEAQALGCNVELAPQPILREGRHENSKIDRTAVVVKATQILSSTLDVPVFASIKGPFTLASFLAGQKKFLTLLLKDEFQASAYISTAITFQKKYLSRLLAVGANIFIGDPMASASIISPAIFKKFAFGPLRSLVGEIRSKGLLAGLHVCGDTRPIMKELDELGFDLLSIEDITPPTRTLKMGGVATATLYEGDREKLSGEISKALEEPFLVLSTSCDVPVKTKQEHVHHMMETFRLHS